ncbi:MAG: hypothetical protein V4499_01380 [Pseudomonadota bacterium]
MLAITKFIAGGAAIAALASAAPATAQYYPGYGQGYGYGNPYGGNVVGQVLNDVLGNGYGGYGANSQVAVNQCAAAVQQRLSGGYGYNGYGAAGGRVLGISRVEPRGNGELLVRGVANSGRYAGYGYNGQSQVDLTWKCRVDYRGFIRDIDINRAQTNYGYGYNQGYTPYGNGNDYSQYGYHRY